MREKDKEKIINFIDKHPELANCFLEMVEIAEDTKEELILGDDAEEATVKAMRKTGHAILEEWAQNKAEKAKEKLDEALGYRRHEKKFTGKPHLEELK